MQRRPHRALALLFALGAGLAACSPLQNRPPMPDPSIAPPPVAAAGIPAETATLWRSPTPPSTLESAAYTPPGLYPAHTPGATYPPLRRWSDVLQFTPYPYATPLPPENRTPIDGVYGLHDPAELPWWNCRRCPDFLPGGGNWRLQFDRGTMHLYYEVTGFGSVGSYFVQDDRVFLFNDPHCLYDVGEYSWRLEENTLILEEVRDACAIHLRAVNLTRQPWVSCQPPNTEAAVTDHWIRPPGCEAID